MSKSRLTERAIRAAVPPAHELTDAQVPGFVLRVTAQGVKSFGLRYRFGGQARRKSYGIYPEVTLEEAREKALADRRILRNGGDPAMPPAPAKTVPTFAQIVERWKVHKQIGEKLRQWKTAYRTVQRYAMPDAETWPAISPLRRAELSLAERPVNAITRKDVIRILEWVRDELGLEGTVNSVHVSPAFSRSRLTRAKLSLGSIR
jgi:hypothetical protein